MCITDEQFQRIQDLSTSAATVRSIVKEVISHELEPIRIDIRNILSILEGDPANGDKSDNDKPRSEEIMEAYLRSIGFEIAPKNSRNKPVKKPDTNTSGPVRYVDAKMNEQTAIRYLTALGYNITMNGNNIDPDDIKKDMNIRYSALKDCSYMETIPDRNLQVAQEIRDKPITSIIVDELEDGRIRDQVVGHDPDQDMMEGLRQVVDDLKNVPSRPTSLS